MISVNKQGILYYNYKSFKCAYGKNGLTYNKIEGDEKTPIGTFSLGKLYVRTDRIKNLKTNFPINNIEKTMAWSDNPKSKYYNTLIKTNKNHTEKFYRKDNLYDLILTIKYNIKPTIPYKGSAIFIHIATKKYSPTKGCIALKLEDFIEILSTLNPNEKIKILY